ncbi:MAG: DUF92 domain-containing protein [Candidatus Marinimicrobia bacterium]|nr:DUF92 domain-containing protein [Candidatus Neomarinimicrobiota bacterium]MCF7840651.1 DUF92 domain-containing protein [Candidatus Neomarinimicrobiota bacterium]MCF7903202.1 DUF92 domain-containing protein [Candidatus Neomarinimicrobiota bacterium]
MPKLFTFSNEWLAFAVFLLTIFVTITLAEIARKYFHWHPEFSRKLVHILVGVLLVFAPFILTSATPAIILGILFVIINYFALKSHVFSGMHATDRISYGTVYFPIAFIIVIALYWNRSPAVMLTALLILAFADTAASIVGEQLTYPKTFIFWQDKKTLAGSLTFFITALIVVLLFFPFFYGLEDNNHGALPLSFLLLLGVITALMSMLAESASRQGSDNLTLTLAAALSLDLTLHNYMSQSLPEFSIWILFSATLGWLAYKFRLLTAGGGVGAFILGVFMFGMGGWQFMVPLIAFFALSSLLSKISDHRGPHLYHVNEKGSNRDIIQVYANGGIALLVTITWYFLDEPMLFTVFLASLAAAMSDTWETELGRLSRHNPRHIITWKPVVKGYSGGVSLPGTMGGIFGAVIIGSIGYLLRPDLLTFPKFLLVTAGSGFLASLVDSIVGATIQAKFACTVCGKETENRNHCGAPSVLIGGIRKIDNDWVNIICTASGALLALLMLRLLQ